MNSYPPDANMQTLMAQLNAATANSPIIGSATGTPGFFAATGGSDKGSDASHPTPDSMEAIA